MNEYRNNKLPAWMNIKHKNVMHSFILIEAIVNMAYVILLSPRQISANSFPSSYKRVTDSPEICRLPYTRKQNLQMRALILSKSKSHTNKNENKKRTISHTTVENTKFSNMDAYYFFLININDMIVLYFLTLIECKM